MTSSSSQGTPAFWRTTPKEAREWGIRQFEKARLSVESTSGYFPRYFHRDRNADGYPVENDVQVAGFITLPPKRVIDGILRQTRKALGTFSFDKRLRFLDPDVMHLTHNFIFPGVNAVEDKTRIAIARAVAPEIVEVVKEFPRMKLTIDGITINERQLMATYRGDEGWNAFMESVARFQHAVPSFISGYDVTKSPIEDKGRALQTTVAVFDRGIDMGALASRVEGYLPGNGNFRPLTYEVESFTLALQQHDSSYVQKIVERIIDAPMPHAIQQDSLGLNGTSLA